MEDLNEFLLKSKEWFEHLVETVRDYAKKYKESETWLSTTLRSIGDAVIATDRLGNIQFVNPIAEDLTGFTREESIGKPLEKIFNIINEETHESVENPVARVIREGIVVGLANHTVLIAKDGKKIPIADSGAPIKDDKGDIIGVVLIFRDITERRKAEQALRESEYKLAERVKELSCLYGLSILFENADISIEAILQGALDLIPPAWQFPEITRARIYFDNKEYRTSNFKETEWKLLTNITIQEKEMIIEVYYLEDKTFLKEEEDLIKDIGKRLKSIIEQRETHQKLNESEKWLATTLKSIGDAVIATDRLGNIQFVNPIAEDLTGFTREESIGKPLEKIFNIINEETHESVENPVARVIREGIVVGLANHTVLIAKDGKKIPIADSGAPIKDDKGNVIGVVLIFRDIIEQKKAEKIIADLAKFPSENPNPILRVGKEEIIYANKAGESIFNIKPGDINPTQIQEDITKAFSTGELDTIEIELNDNIYAIDITHIKEEDYANIYGKDITERKETERKLEESEKEYREAYNLAEFYKDLFTHDINNILQNILTGIQLSERIIGDPENWESLKKYNTIIKKQLKRGAKLVSNIRKLSKLEDQELSLKKVEICSILEKSTSYVKSVYQDRNIDIQIDSVSKKLYIRANELLEDLFENILVNAIKYNENPTVEILVKISKEKKEIINYLKMEFLDNGIGIDDSRKNFVFQRGYSEEKSVHGMGLGLSLVKKIIDTYNGKIWVEDRIKGDYKKGSNFILLIPEVL